MKERDHSFHDEELEEYVSKESDFSMGTLDMEVRGLIPPVIEDTGEIRIKGNLDEPEIQENIINEGNIEKLKNMAEQRLHAVWKPKLGKIAIFTATASAIAAGIEFGIRDGRDIKELYKIVEKRLQSKNK